MKQIRNLVDRISRYTIASALAALGMGVLLLFASDAMFRLVCVIFGLMLLLPGLLWIYDGVVKGGGALLIAPGVVFTLAGAFVCFRSEAVAAIMGVLFGVFLLVAGLSYMGRALLRRLTGETDWLFSCLLGAGVCAFGVVCMVKRGEATGVLLKIYGVAFLLYAAVALISAFEFNKTAKKTLDRAEDAVAGAVGYAETDAPQPDVVRTADSVVEVDGKVIDVINDADDE